MLIALDECVTVSVQLLRRRTGVSLIVASCMGHRTALLISKSAS